MNNSRILTEWLDKDSNKISLNNNSTKFNRTPYQRTDIYDPNRTYTNYSDKDNFTKLENHLKTCWKTCRAKVQDHTASFVLSNDPNEGRVGSERILIEVGAVGDKNSDYWCRVEDQTDFSNWERLLDFSAKTFEEVLNELFKLSLIKDINLSESVSLSTIDDFKLYENLWY